MPFRFFPSRLRHLFRAALLLGLPFALWQLWQANREGDGSHDLWRATYDPIHFAPAILQARDEDCLLCHREVLLDRVREKSPAGLPAQARRAAYQEVSTYAGEQETFHRRHLVTPLARELMDLRCNTCHVGHEPRDEAPGTSATAIRQGSLRKQVDVESICLKCHGRLNPEQMGLPGPWPEVKAAFGDSCLSCHASIRSVRHRVNYLKAEAIEAAAAKDSEICHGCHGGRAWYRLSYPYPRHPWPGSESSLPAWAKDRATESEARFLPPPTVDRESRQKP